MLRILLIDDNPHDRRLAARALHQAFAELQINEITEAFGFQKALQSGQFDAIVLDYQLRWSNGLELLKEIKTHYADRPVVMFTNSATQEIAVEAMKSGLDDYVVKSSTHYVRLAAAIQNALDRIEAQRKAIGLELRLQTLLNQLNVGVYRLTSNGELLEGNAAFFRLLGLNSLTEMPANQTLEAYFQPDEYAQLLAQLRQNGEVREREIQLQRADATVLWVKISKTFTRVGDIKIIDGLIEDISDRKRIEAERNQAQHERERLLAQEQIARAEAEAQKARSTFLAEASRLLGTSLDYRETLSAVARLVVSHLADWCFMNVIEPNTVYFIDPIIAAADPQQEPYLLDLCRQYPPSADIDVGIPKVLRTGEPELAIDIPEPLLEAFAQNAKHREQIDQLHPQSYILVPLIARGVTLGVLMLVSVQPERRYSQADLDIAIELAQRIALAIDNARLHREAQDANRMKDEFLAIVSHELRTPLNSILGWSQMLKSGRLQDDMTAKALDTIERNAKLQNRLINDILDISRIIQNHLELDLQPISLIPVIEAALSGLHPIAEAKSIVIKTNLDASVGKIMGDSERLQQVVWNLLSNALKFTPSGGLVEICLETIPPAQDPMSEKGSYAQITVQDNGQGISTEFLPRVFERFRQEDNRKTRIQSGLGLGLAIVRHLVEMHQGTVYALSEGEGKGAVFTVQLPLL